MKVSTERQGGAESQRERERFFLGGVHKTSPLLRFLLGCHTAKL